MTLLIRKAVSLLKKTSTAKEWTVAQLTIANHFHSHQVSYNKTKEKEERFKKQLSLKFNVRGEKEKEAYLEVIRNYGKESKFRSGHAEFIRYAMKYMEEFGVHKDLDTYKALLDVFPKGLYIPENIYQSIFWHYPKQQFTAMALLRKMEQNCVIPDYEIQEMLLNIFGVSGYALKRFWRMTYWMPKFSELNPWPVPEPTPTDPKELAWYAVSKLSSVDVQAKVTVYTTKDVPDAVDDTWIVSSISKSQQELLAVQPTDKALFIEGPFFIWVADQHIHYFVLRGDPIKREIVYDDFDDVSNLKIPFWEKLNTGIPPTIHEQEEGVYYATCATGTSSKDSLLSWIRCLQRTNPILEKIPIMFKLQSFNENLRVEGNEQGQQIPENTKNQITSSFK